VLFHYIRPEPVLVKTIVLTFLAIYVAIETIILPRQAREKHRKASKRTVFTLTETSATRSSSAGKGSTSGALM
jgi:hypothetical protein